tara:strand:- start:5878 stop:6204 length:327 start_codon:yes stop_codon:yes gene_type:complete
MNSLEWNGKDATYGIENGAAMPPELFTVFCEEDIEEIKVFEDTMEINLLPSERMSFIRINQWSIEQVEELGFIFNSMTFSEHGPSLIFVRKGYENEAVCRCCSQTLVC